LPIYASRGFLQTVGDDYGWIGGYDDCGVRCILPYTVIHKFGIRMVRFRLETTPLRGDLSEGEEQLFLSGVNDYFRSVGTDLIIPSGNTALFRTCPSGALTCPYGTFVNDLTQSEELLMRGIRKTYRQMIRRAMQTVEIRHGLEYLDVAHHLIADTLKRSGLHFKTLKEFEATILSLGSNVEVFVAEHAGVIHGCMVSPFSAHSAYNWYAGSVAEPVFGAMQLLHWEAMRYFRGIGVRRFNFQGVRVNPDKGSKQEGIMTYKKGFGGEFVKGCMWKYAFHQIKASVYSIAARFLAGGDMRYTRAN